MARHLKKARCYVRRRREGAPMPKVELVSTPRPDPAPPQCRANGANLDSLRQQHKHTRQISTGMILRKTYSWYRRDASREALCDSDTAGNALIQTAQLAENDGGIDVRHAARRTCATLAGS